MFFDSRPYAVLLSGTLAQTTSKAMDSILFSLVLAWRAEVAWLLVAAASDVPPATLGLLLAAHALTHMESWSHRPPCCALTLRHPTVRVLLVC